VREINKQVCDEMGVTIVNGALSADSDDRAHVFRSDAAQRSDLIARR
jgi:hypothetical protein